MYLSIPIGNWQGCLMWSQRHEQCTECGTREKPHRGRGLCKTCYERFMGRRHRNPSSKRGSATQKLTEDYLLNEYVRNKKSLGEIAADCGCSRVYVHRMMRRHGIPVRVKGEARSLALKRGKVTVLRTDSHGEQYRIKLSKTTVNEGFFSSWSSEMAYVLGFVYTDGCLSPHKNGGGALIIAQKDPEILNKIAALMNCETKLSYTARREYPTGAAGALWHFRIWSRRIYTDLLAIGLTPRKSRSITFPAVPWESVRHFIRGCWDGDGSVYITRRDNRIAASFVSGSMDFVTGMLAMLYKAGLPERRVSPTSLIRPSYSFRFSGRSCERLYHFMYDGVPASQYLERKYRIFKDYFDSQQNLL